MANRTIANAELTPAQIALNELERIGLPITSPAPRKRKMVLRDEHGLHRGRPFLNTTVTIDPIASRAEIAWQVAA